MSLTIEQQQALDELSRYIKPAPAAAPQGDAWKAVLGISKDDVQAMLKNLATHKQDFELRVLDWFDRNPLDEVFQFIGVSSWAFYQVEKGINPKINTYIDAFYYIATCASVGYADMFAATQAGRSIAALVMVVGPALAARSLDRPYTAPKLAPISQKDEASNP